MDLARFNKTGAEKGATLHVRHPATDEPMHDEDGEAMTFTLRGVDSGAFKRAIADAAGEEVRGKKKPSVLDLDKAERRTAKALAACVIAIGGKWEYDGEPVTVENVEKLFLECPWLRLQVDEFIGERANFFADA